MDRALGLLLLGVYIVGVVGLAAAVTFAVIKIFPTERTPKAGAKTPDDGKPDERKPSGNGAQGGRLYRRSKRGAT